MTAHIPKYDSSPAHTVVSSGSRRCDAVDAPARRWGVLASITVLMALVWLQLLPLLASRPSVRREIDFLEAHEIDPSAMFYTELEATDAALNRVEAFHRRHPLALWIPVGDENLQNVSRPTEAR